MKEQKTNIKYIYRILPGMPITATNTNPKCRKGFGTYVSIIRELSLPIRLNRKMEKFPVQIQDALDQKLFVMICAQKPFTNEV